MKQFLKFFFFFLLLTVGLFFYLQPQPNPVSAQTQPPDTDWYMAGANPQRTSWVSEDVKGRLYPVWYRPVEPYVNPKVQVIAGGGKVYLSTAKGLYAFNASNGNLDWVYGTQLPLGHSPTYYNGILYVGGYDRRLHAVDAQTGEAVTSFNPPLAGAGIETNPLIVNDTIYVGCRDGYLYAYALNDGSLKWRFQTNGPILFSPAYDPSTSSGPAVYFASNDMHAYAVNAVTGQQIWKSEKLLGSGFHSFWPVIYGDYVVFAGGENYYFKTLGWHIGLGLSDFLTTTEMKEIFPEYDVSSGPTNTPLGPISSPGPDDAWANGNSIIDATRAINYFEEKPWRRTVFILNRSNGQEYTFDSDSDGLTEYAPFLYAGTHSGTCQPPIVLPDKGMFLNNFIYYNPWIGRSIVTNWKWGTQYLSLSGPNLAVDEPMVLSSGGNTIHWSQIQDNTGGSYDILSDSLNKQGLWVWYGHYSNDMRTLIPDYASQFYSGIGWRIFGNANGIYAQHTSTQSPPIPYQGMVFMHRYNAIMAFSPTGTTHTPLALAEYPSEVKPGSTLTKNEVQDRLKQEVEKMINAGHLRPGYHGTGIFDGATALDLMGDYPVDYFHNPSDTYIVLLRALPYLPTDLQSQLRSYLQQEFASYPATSIAHIGWKDGTPREDSQIPPEIESQIQSFGPMTTNGSWGRAGQFYNWWIFPQYNFYAVWKYAQEFGNASGLFNQIRNKIEEPPTDDFLINRPQFLNAYIAGYWGYLELQKLAGEQEDTGRRTTLNRLLDLRVNHFTKDSPFTENGEYIRALNNARNFMYLTPELADYLQQHIKPQVAEAIDEYQRLTPNWFVSKYDVTLNEGTLHPLYDYHTMFQAKALILKQPYDELVKYLDVPAFARGDLFYIDNLVSALEAPETSPSPSTTPGCQSDINGDGTVNLGDIVAVLGSWGQSGGAGDLNEDGTVNLGDVVYILNFWGLGC